MRILKQTETSETRDKKANSQNRCQIKGYANTEAEEKQTESQDKKAKSQNKCQIKSVEWLSRVAATKDYLT